MKSLSLPVLTIAILAVCCPVIAQEGEFVPVTDAMLENPDPADWLMWRRTHDGWGYSPLDQIDRDNVNQMQLVWTRGWKKVSTKEHLSSMMGSCTCRIQAT